MLTSGMIDGFDYKINYTYNGKKYTITSQLPCGMIFQSTHQKSRTMFDAARKHDKIRQRPQDIVWQMCKEGNVTNAIVYAKRQGMEIVDGVLRGAFGQMMINA